MRTKMPAFDTRCSFGTTIPPAPARPAVGVSRIGLGGAFAMGG